MELSIRICIFTVSQPQFVHVAGFKVFLCSRATEIIIIHKIVSCIVRRVNVYHLYLAQIGTLEQFQHFQVVTLNVDIFCVVPIDRIFYDRTQCLVGRACRFRFGCILTHPRKLIAFTITLYGVVAQQLAQCLKVHLAGCFAGLGVESLGKYRRGYAVERVHIELCTILRIEVQMV